jgi:acetyl esterase/lipase
MTHAPHISVQRLLRMVSMGAPTKPSDVAARRAGLEQLAALAGGGNVPVALVEDTRLGGVRVRRYRPRGAKGVLLYLHGGGWVAGSVDTHDNVCRRLAVAARRIVVSVDYRRAPEHPYPAALHDAWAVLRALNQPVAVAGDSAGGALAAALCLRARDEGVAIERLLLICPILDIAGETESRLTFGSGYFIEQPAFEADVAMYCPDPALWSAPEVSPLNAPSLKGLPPVDIHTAEFDPFRDEGEAFAQRLAEDGVPVHLSRHDGMVHYFYALPGLVPYAEKAVADMGRALGPQGDMFTHFAAE